MLPPTSALVAAEITRHSPLPLALIDLATMQVLEMSDPGLRMLRGERKDVVGQLATTFSDDKQQSGDAFRAVAQDLVQGYQAARRLTRVDGTVFDAWVWTRRVPDADVMFLLLTDEPVRRDPHPVSADPHSNVVGVVDDGWRVVTISTDVEELLGVSAGEVVGCHATERIHPDDLPELLVAVAECLRTSRGACAAVRVLDGEERWRQVRIALSALDGHGDRRVAFVLSAPAAEDDLELQHLRRIASELRAVGLLGARTPTLQADAGGLSARQHQILERLLEGSRVPAIARDLYLSQSTVRNHLSQLFRKYGVHSQTELIEVVRGQQLARTA